MIKLSQALEAQAAAPEEAVKVSPPKAKSKPKSETTALVEEFVDLHERLTEVNAFVLIKTYEDLKKKLQSIAADCGADADVPFTFKSEVGDVVFTAATKSKVISDREKLIALITPEVFMEVAKVTLTEAGKYLSANELAQVTKTENGSRRLASVTVTQTA